MPNRAVSNRYDKHKKRVSWSWQEKNSPLIVNLPFQKSIAFTSLRPTVSNTQPSSQNRISRVQHNTSCSARLPTQASSSQTILLLPAQPLGMEILGIFYKLCSKMHLQVIWKAQSIISCNFLYLNCFSVHKGNEMLVLSLLAPSA